MCKDDGMVMDDGVTTRLAEDHFHMTTTTGGAAGVLDWLEEWLQTEWPELRVYLTSVTEQWAVATLSGPAAKNILTAAGVDIDLANDAFPFMSMKKGMSAVCLHGCSAFPSPASCLMRLMCLPDMAQPSGQH